MLADARQEVFGQFDTAGLTVLQHGRQLRERVPVIFTHACGSRSFDHFWHQIQAVLGSRRHALKRVSLVLLGDDIVA